MRNSRSFAIQTLESSSVPLFTHDHPENLVTGICAQSALRSQSQAAGRGPRRTELEGAGQREQHSGGAAGVVVRAIAERGGDADIGLPVVEQEQAPAAAGRGQRQAVVDAEADVPGRAAVDETVELIAIEIAK